MSTKIEWVRNPDGTKGEVWNPTTGCSKVSAGCKNCYAERIAKRFWGNEPNRRKFTDVLCHPERLVIPLHWKKPRRIFVDSMSDLFHEDVPDDFIWRVWLTIQNCPQHIFLILTKRPQRMLSFIKVYYLKNVWLGVSVEDQKTADERIPLLLQTPAALRFISVEPMLEEVMLWRGLDDPKDNYQMLIDCLDWVICGCESGPRARPMELDWARSLRDQCVEAGIPFFFKQAMIKINGKLVKMPELDGRVWDQYPQTQIQI